MDVVKTILNKGLDQDHSPEEQPQGTYRFAENLINNSTESINELAVEPAVVQKLALESNEVLVGYVAIDDERICLFSVKAQNGLKSRISLFSIINNTRTILATGELNFSLYYPITGIYRKRNGDIELVYFTDGLNPPRVININKVYGAGTELNLSLQKRVERIPNLDVKVNEDFGLLESGSYNVAIKLIDEDFQETNWLNVSDVIYIYKDTANTDTPQLFLQKSGDFPNVLDGANSICSKNIQVTVSNLPNGYKYYKLALIEATSGSQEITKVKVTQRIDIRKATYVFDSWKEDFETITPEEILIQPPYIKSAKTLTILDNKLVLGNIEYEENNWDFLKDYSSKIMSEAIPYYPEIDKEEQYLKTDMSFYKENSRGYMPNELYAFGIVYFFEDGTFSPVQHIHGETQLAPAISSDAVKMQENNTILTRYLYERPVFNAVGYDFQNMWVKHHRFPKADIASISDLPTSDFHCWDLPVVASPYKTNKHTPASHEAYTFAGLFHTLGSLGLTSLGVPILRQIRVKKIKWEIIISFYEQVPQADSFNAGVIPQFYTKFDLEWDYGTGLYITSSDADNNCEYPNGHAQVGNLSQHIFGLAQRIEDPLPVLDSTFPAHFFAVKQGYKAKYKITAKTEREGAFRETWSWSENTIVRANDSDLDTEQDIIIDYTDTNISFFTPISVSRYGQTVSSQYDCKQINPTYLKIEFSRSDIVYTGVIAPDYRPCQRLYGIRFKNILLPQMPKKAVGYQIVRAERDEKNITKQQAVLQRIVKYSNFYTYSANYFRGALQGGGTFSNKFYALVVPEHVYATVKNTVFNTFSRIGIFQCKIDESSGIWINDVFPGSSYNEDIHSGAEDTTGFGFLGRWHEQVYQLDSFTDNNEYKIKNIWDLAACSQISVDDVKIYNIAANQRVLILELEEEADLILYSDYGAQMLVELSRDIKNPYSNYTMIPYNKEHTNIVNTETITLFNGDVNETIIRRPNIIYWDTKLAEREKKSQVWKYIVAGIVVVAGVVAGIFTGGAATAAGIATAASILSGVSVAAAVGAGAISIVLSGIRADEMFRLYTEEYDKGIRRTMQDAITNNFFGILNNSNEGYVGDSNAAYPEEDQIIYYMNIVNNLSIMSTVKAGLSPKKDFLADSGILRPTLKNETARYGSDSWLPLTYSAGNDVAVNFYGDLKIGTTAVSSASAYMLAKCLVTTLKEGEQQYKYRGIVMGDLTYQNLDYIRENKEEQFYMDSEELKKNQKLETRIIWSENSKEEDLQDYFRIFKANNYKDLQSTFGAILDLTVARNLCFVFCENTVLCLRQSQQERVNNEIVTMIGSGSYFEQDPVQVMGEGNQLILGSDFQFSHINVNGTIFYMSEKNKNCFIINGSSAAVPIPGLTKFFNNNLDFTWAKQNEAAGNKFWFKQAVYHPLYQGIIMGYDKENKRILIAKKEIIDVNSKFQYLPLTLNSLAASSILFQTVNTSSAFFINNGYILENRWNVSYPNGFIGIPLIRDLKSQQSCYAHTPADATNFTLSYSLANRAWSSFHSYLPTQYLTIPNSLFITQIANAQSTTPKSLIAKYENSNYLKYLARDLTMEIEVILAQSPLVPLITEYLKIFFEYPEDLNNNYKQTIASVHAYNDYMSTEVINLVPTKESAVGAQNFFQQVTQNKTTTRNELGWDINTIRNKKQDNKYPPFYVAETYQKSFTQFLTDLTNNPLKKITFVEANFIDANKDWSKQEMMRGNYIAVRFKTSQHRLILFRHILAIVQQSVK